MKYSDKSNTITAVKILNTETGLFMTRGGGWSKRGSVWNTVGHAKLALNNAYLAYRKTVSKETEALLRNVQILESVFSLVPSQGTKVHVLDVEKIKNTGSFA